MSESPTVHSSSPQGPQWGSIIVGLLLVAAVGGGAWWYFSGSETTEPTPEAPPQTETPEPEVPIDPNAIDAVKEGLAEEGPEDALDQWLAVPGILQRIVAAVWKVSEGESPRKVLGFVDIEGFFKVDESDEEIVVSAESYARYDPAIDALVSVSPEKAAAVYTRLRPQLNARFQQVATKGERFHTVAKRAIDRILAVELPAEPIQLEAVGATFFYKDEKTEALDAADKHVIRLGPDNVAKLKTWLRSFAKAAGLD